MISSCLRLRVNPLHSVLGDVCLKGSAWFKIIIFGYIIVFFSRKKFELQKLKSWIMVLNSWTKRQFSFSMYGCIDPVVAQQTYLAFGQISGFRPRQSRLSNFLHFTSIFEAKLGLGAIIYKTAFKRFGQLLLVVLKLPSLISPHNFFQSSSKAIKACTMIKA